MIKNPTEYNILSLKYVAASFLATSFSGVVHPLDLIKTRFQSHDGRSAGENLVPRYSGVQGAIKKIYKDEGFRGLYKGFYISLLCQASSMSFFFWQYQTRKDVYEREGWQKMAAVRQASTQASVFTTLLTQPLWVVKTRMLLNVRPNVGEWQNCLQTVREVKRQYGVKGFLKGLQLSLILSLAGVIQMYTYQGAKILYQRAGIPQTKLQEKHFICGALSKVFSVFVSYPITTLRTRIQQNQFIAGKQKYKGVTDLARRTFKQEGIQGFFKGMSANLLRGISQRGLYFYFYQIFKGCFFPSRSCQDQ